MDQKKPKPKPRDGAGDKRTGADFINADKKNETRSASGPNDAKRTNDCAAKGLAIPRILRG